MRSIGDVSIDTSNIANNRGRQTVVIVAVLGLLAAYIHAELYTAVSYTHLPLPTIYSV